ncbi:hypothetical protein ACJJTC_003379 [Scirpophaga incertulas]
MTKLYNYDKNSEDTENLNILYRLYSVFNINPSQSPSAQNVLPSHKKNIPMEFIEPPLTIQDEPNKEIEIYNEDRYDEEIAHEQNIFNEYEMNKDNNSQCMLSNNDNCTDDLLNTYTVPETPQNITPTKQVNSDISTNSAQVNVQQPIDDTSPAFKIIPNSLLGNFLTLPKTPERKGKRNTVRMPFAVTSAKYRAMFKEQNMKKELEIKAKAEKKKKKKEIKLQKEKEKIEKTKSANRSSQALSTNACKVCCKSTKTSNRVVCDMCSAIYHLKYVPAKHQEHVPEDLRIDLFICYCCYKEDNNETLDLSSEKNSEDSGDDAQTLVLTTLSESRRKAVHGLDSLFISTRAKVCAASRVVIAGWIKTALKELGIDSSPGSIHSAVGSNRFDLEMPLDDILRRGNWRNSNNFLKFYCKPIERVPVNNITSVPSAHFDVI